MATVDALTSCLFEYHLFPISVSFLYLQIIVFRKKLSKMEYDLPDDGYHLKSQCFNGLYSTTILYLDKIRKYVKLRF